MSMGYQFVARQLLLPTGWNTNPLMLGDARAHGLLGLAADEAAPTPATTTQAASYAGTAASQFLGSGSVEQQLSVAGPAITGATVAGASALGAGWATAVI